MRQENAALLAEIAVLTREIRKAQDTIQELCEKEQEMLGKREALRKKLLAAMVADGIEFLAEGKSKARVVEDIDPKIIDLEEIPPDLLLVERTTTRRPRVGKIRRRLLAGKAVPGAVLERKKRLVVR